MAPDAQLQAIAAENNLPETAFIIARKEHFDLRWLTPKVEVDLCGHATLASAHVIFHHLDHAGDTVSFQSRSGGLTVARVEDRLVLDFPSQPVSECEPPKKIGRKDYTHEAKIGVGRGDYLAVFDREGRRRSVEARISRFWLSSMPKASSRLRPAMIAISSPRYFAPRSASRRIR